MAPGNGILKQLKAERQAASSLGIEFDTKIYCPKPQGIDDDIFVNDRWLTSSFWRRSLYLKPLQWLMHRVLYTVWLLKVHKQYDVIIARYYVHDPFQLLFTILSRRPVIFVHHSNEVRELATGGFFGKFRALLEILIGPLCVQFSDAVIGVTEEIASNSARRCIYGDRDYYVYPNGIASSEISATDDNRAEVPELLFVSSYFYEWHGLDLLLKALAHSAWNVKVHVVGEVGDANYSAAKRDERVTLHGTLTRDEIHKLGSRCTVGISSLALSRIGMSAGSTLKVREYLAMGLPVFAGYKEEFPENFPFFKESLDDLLADLQHCIDTWRAIDRQTIILEATDLIDKTKLLDQLYSKLVVAIENPVT